MDYSNRKKRKTKIPTLIELSIMVVSMWALLSCPALGALSGLTVTPSNLDAYQLVTITFDDQWSVDNPCDPRDAEAKAVFTPPSGPTIEAPGFLYQDFTRTSDTWLEANGAPVWMIRYRPEIAGSWSAVVSITIDESTTYSDSVNFTVNSATGLGHIQVASANSKCFEFENGDPYIPSGTHAGADFPYMPNNPKNAYRSIQVQYYLQEIADAGGNFARIRCDGRRHDFEMVPNEEWGYEGCGRYHDWTCYEIDEVFDKAETIGVILQMCNMDADQTCMDVDPPSIRNYFLKDYGGPLQNPSGFWTDAEVERLVKQRIRYVIARWGHSPAFGSYEFFNELKLAGDTVPSDPSVTGGWLNTMGAYFKSIDPYDHLVCSSTQGGYQDTLVTEFWQHWNAAASLDIVEYHSYHHHDLALGLGTWNLLIEPLTTRPLLIGEFGTNKDRETYGGNASVDPDGIHMHNGIWGSGMTNASAHEWHSEDAVLLGWMPAITRWTTFCTDWNLNEGSWSSINASVSGSAYRVYAMGLNGNARFWVQNVLHNYMDVYNYGEPTNSPAETISVPMSEDVLSLNFTGTTKDMAGKISPLGGDLYQVEWWDPYLMQVVLTEEYTLGGSGEATFSPTDDTFANKGNPSTNYGDITTIQLRSLVASYARLGFLKFNVTGISGSVTSAKLRLYSNDLNGQADAKVVTDTSWTELTLTWNNMPAMGSIINSQTMSSGAWSEFDVTGYITGNGTYSLGLETPVDLRVYLSSKEGASPPELVINYGSGGDTTPPAAPTGLGATPGDSQVALDWNDNTESDLDGYNVYRSTTSGSGFSKINGSLVTPSDYTDDTASNGTTYYYVVTAVDTSSNESGYSNEDSACPQGDTTPPANPTGLAATPGDEEVSLDWNDNTESDLDGYNVYRSTTTGSGYSKINGSLVSASAYTDATVSNDTTYYYVVTAVDTSSNESGYSNEDSALPQSNDIYVYDITMGGYESKTNYYCATATVWIKDTSLNNINGATVYGSWSGATKKGDGEKTTGTDGKAILTSSAVKGGGTFTFTVTNVTATGYTYNSSLNNEDYDSITLP